jgi:IS605 OrfB family transposase
MIMPAKATAHLNAKLTDGWLLAKTIRLGRDHRKRLFVDFIVEKPRPPLRTEGTIEGLDSNYKKGVVLSDQQIVGQPVYERIQTFAKRQKHTAAEIKSLIGQALKQLDLTAIMILCVENLKQVRHGTRGKFPRTLNRRLSHWLYGYIVDWLARRCEEVGIRLERKHPAYTSTTCPICNRCDRRNRVRDWFQCRHCGFSWDADRTAALNLKRLGEAGVYGLRSLPSWHLVT